MSGNAVRIIPPSADLADVFAKSFIEAARKSLPDLASRWILTPSPAGAAHLRHRLAHHAGRGLLGPRLDTLAGYAAQQDGPPPLSPLECRLMLTEALRRHRSLFPGQDRSEVAEALFELFEELTLAHFEPGADEAAFAARLRVAYGAPALEFLSREAQIVHVLWQAYAQDCAGRSPAAVHLAKLKSALAAVSKDAPLVLLGFDSFTRAEGELVAEALRMGRAELWLHGRLEGHNGEALRLLLAQLKLEAPAPEAATPGPLSALLDASFTEGEGTHTFTPRNESVRPLSVVEAGGAEHEARCVDLAVRKALLAGKTDVVVLAQDRRLARRLRALLERAHVPLQDFGGWALTTSRAAAALDAWLECIEGRFRFRPLLDLLKSGYVEVAPEALDRLERTLVYREGIEGGLAELLAHAKEPGLEALLKKLKESAFTVRTGEARDARTWTQELLKSLEYSGLSAHLAADEAGSNVLRVLAQLDGAFARVPIRLRWDELRELVDTAVERATFSPGAARSPVRLLTLEQAQGVRCEFLVLAGATRDALPGSPPRQPFFSSSVRGELGLSDWRSRRSLALARLRNALEGADEILVTYAAGADEEPAQASPWIEAIETQAAQAGITLMDTALAQDAANPDCEIGDIHALPAQPARRPAPATPAALIPEKLSATAHQALIDCPYRFFARSLLRLESEHAPDEDPDRSDYGKLVHRILEAFAQPVKPRPGEPPLPPPFTERITNATRDRAQARLEAIADALLAGPLSRRAMALTWKAEFRAAIPELLEWMIARPLLKEIRAEVQLEQPLEGVRLHGIVDRLETRNNGSRVVVDYKTGRRLPGEDDIEAGEAVQLIHYALLDDKVEAVEYRQLRKSSDSLALEQQLPQLRQQVRERLAASIRAMRAGAALPAQGDAPICERCDYQGLCRRQDWHE